MRTANMTLYFKNDNAIIFGEPEKLIVRKSGHYALPISPYNKILKNIVTGTNPNTALITISNKSKKKIMQESYTGSSLIQHQHIIRLTTRHHLFLEF